MKLPIETLHSLIEKREQWLVKRVFEYAKKRQFLKYNSTLEEAWRVSVVGLSNALINALHYFKVVPELGPDENYLKDPVATFAIIEAQRHRKRGVTLSMFLGLMKYYKQSYMDLISESELPEQQKGVCRLFIERCFDRIEIGFCTEWTGITEIQKLIELQITNRQMTNEKNKYLTIFESLHSPAILMNNENSIENLNHAAAQLIESSASPGGSYYSHNEISGLPWLNNEISEFAASHKLEGSFEKEIETSKGKRYYKIKLKKMLDISGKFTGTVLLFDDLTERKKMEKKLSLLATTDSLTGIYNRGWYLTLSQKEILRSRRYNLPLSLIMADIDHFKLINDTFGHQAGDVVLKNVSRELQQQLRAVDIMGRLGGEEFGITLIESNLEKAASTAERLREKIAGCGVMSNGSEIHFTISLGVAQLDGKEHDIHAILKKADEALYSAKRNGRNCVQTLVDQQAHCKVRT